MSCICHNILLYELHLSQYTCNCTSTHSSMVPHKGRTPKTKPLLFHPLPCSGPSRCTGVGRERREAQKRWKTSAQLSICVSTGIPPINVQTLLPIKPIIKCNVPPASCLRCIFCFSCIYVRKRALGSPIATVYKANEIFNICKIAN